VRHQDNRAKKTDPIARASGKYADVRGNTHRYRYTDPRKHCPKESRSTLVERHPAIQEKAKSRGVFRRYIIDPFGGRRWQALTDGGVLRCLCSPVRWSVLGIRSEYNYFDTCRFIWTPYSSTSLVVCVSMNNIYVAWVPIQSDYLFICCYESKSAVGGCTDTSCNCQSPSVPRPRSTRLRHNLHRQLYTCVDMVLTQLARPYITVPKCLLTVSLGTV